MSTRDDRSPVALHRITDDDWELWREVRLRALTDAPDAFGSTLAHWQGDGDREQRWRSRLIDVPLNIVATAGDALVGQVSGTAPDRQGRVELISLWVDPDARGQGVGDALIAEVGRGAREVGAGAVVLTVRDSNAHAIRTYRRAGFTAIDEPADVGEARMLLRVA